MIQFNLLPDVKLDYIKAKRLKRLLISISVLVAGASIIVAILLFLAVNVIQKKHLNDLNKDITAATKQVQATPNIDRILTVQNQLNSLPALYNSRPAATRVFKYLAQITPANVTIESVAVDFTANTMTFTGAAKDFLGVNTFVDTLKFTGFSTDGTTKSSGNAFSKVVLSTFGTSDTGSSYNISLSYVPSLFDNQKSTALIVPSTITTRSQAGQTTALFQQSSTKVGGH